MSGNARPGATWRVLGLELGIDEPESALWRRAREAAGLPEEAVRGARIAHKAIDARRQGRRRAIRFVVHVDLQLDADYEASAPAAFRDALRAGRVVARAPAGSFDTGRLHASLEGARVVVVGSGPAGLFAAWMLAHNGVSVDLLDRGPALRSRSRALARFHRTRALDPENNLLFGEGGAGTYSDGKIYTRIDHPLEQPILEVLIACGAPAEIAYDARAHIGTDRLHRILPRLRERLVELGVRFHFETRLDALRLAPGTPRRVTAVETNAGELRADAVLLALGHSARDTLRALAEQGVAACAKPFQLGVRIEHPQAMIDAGRYGDPSLAERLGVAYYGLVSKARGATPAAHSFCMCPGGQIVASVNAPGELCTNGMSNSRHSSPYANAALVTTLGPREFGPGAFAGVALQQRLEARCFELGGGDYTAPAQRASDFLAARASAQLGRSSYRFGVRPERIDALLPERVRDALALALERFERQIPGYAGEEALLVGIESRSSGPLRLPRDAETRRAQGFANLFPVGEGAGYAGGIMSAAIDGARSAEALIRYGVR